MSLNLTALCPESLFLVLPRPVGSGVRLLAPLFFSVMCIHHLPCMDVLMRGQGFLSQSLQSWAQAANCSFP